MAVNPESIERIPPHNIEAEQSLLGALLIDKDAVNRTADALTPADFYKTSHGMIFEAMLELYEKHEPIDLLSLGNRLDERKQLEAIGGRSYLIGLAQVVPTSSNVAHYARIIQKKATLRRLQTVAAEIADLSYTDEDLEDVLDKAEERVFSVSQKANKQGFSPLKAILDEAFERIDAIHKEGGGMRGIPTGFAQLDNLLAGLQKSDLIVIAARPSVGKTSLALDFARRIGIRAKHPVGIFSLEMSKEQLVDRMICAEAGIDLWKMRTGKLQDREGSDDFVRIGHAMNALSEAKIFIDDSASANILEIKSKARRLQSEHGLDCIILDYLQLMEGKMKTEGRVQEIAEITRGLKAIARELNVPVIALSQLSRQVEMMKPAIPRLSHLRDSGTIEQDADVVIFIYRKAADRNYRLEELTDEEKHLAEIMVAKHRNGPTGNVKLYWDEKRVSFRNLDVQRQSDEPLFQVPF